MFDRISHLLIRILFLIFFVLLLYYVFQEARRAGYSVFADRPYDSSSSATETVITVRDDESLLDIAKDLERTGIVENAYITAMAFRSMEDYDQIKPGEYLVRASMKPSEILDVLIQKEEAGEEAD